MALTTPTTQDLNNNIIAQLEASLNQTIPLLPKSFLRVLAKVLAGVFVILYKYTGFMFLQIFVQTAAIEETEVNGVLVSPLINWGRLIGTPDPIAATNAELNVTVTVETQTGSLAAGSQLVGDSNGVTYLTLAAVALDAATVTVQVVAASDQAGGGGAGTLGNLVAGDGISFANPLPNIARAAVVLSQQLTAADAEATALYRQRVIDRFQKRPQGGAYSDYENWGEEVAGIVNVYPYTSACPGQVELYVEATEASSGSADGIPTNAQLQQVLNSVELDDAGLASRRPLGVLVNALAIDRREFAATITGLVVDDTVQTQADILQGVTEYFLEREPFIPGLSIPPRRDRITETGVGGIIEDIVSAAGGIFTNVDLTINVPDLATSAATGETYAPIGTSPDAITWRPDGLMFFVADSSIIYSYTVPVAFDLSSAIGIGGNENITTQDTSAESVRFSSDGRKMFVLGATNDTVFEYTIATAFDLDSTVTFTGNSFDVNPQATFPRGLEFNDVGTKFFVSDGTTGKIFEYTLSIPFDFSSTIAYSGNSFDVSSEDANPRDLAFYDNGLRMYVLGAANKTIYSYTLSVPYSLGTTVTYDSSSFSVNGEDTDPRGIALNGLEDKFYMIGDSANDLFEYDLGTTDDAVSIYTLGIGEKSKITTVSYL